MTLAVAPAPAHREGTAFRIALGCAVLVLLSAAPESLLARHVSPDLQNRTAILLALSLGAGGLLLATALRPEALWRALKASWPLIAFALLALASTAWSLVPEGTLRSGVHVTGFILAAIALAALLDWRDLLLALGIASLALGASSVLVAPFGGIMSELHIGALSGPFGEKNQAGQAFAMGTLVSAILAVDRRGALWSLGAGFLFALVLWSQSMTGLIAALLGLAALLAVEIMRCGRLAFMAGLWALGVLLLAGAVILPALAADLPALVGREGTLTGRTDIWAAILRHAEAGPWFGHGYDAFWEEGSMPMAWVRSHLEFEVSHAHNGALDIYLGLGLAGLGLIAFILIRIIMSGLKHLYLGGTAKRFLLPDRKSVV